MSSHRLTAGCYRLTVVAALFLYAPVHARFAASIEKQITDQHGVVTGTVTYRQRIALPRQAVVQVQLLDISSYSSRMAMSCRASVAATGLLVVSKEKAIRFDSSWPPQ